jgi:signal transduction histidine kinase
MTTTGIFTRVPQSRYRWMVSIHAVWLLTVALLVAWWGRLLNQQAGRIVELEQQLGIFNQVAEDQWHRTQRMLFWESTFFLVFLILSTVIIFWFHIRDYRRTRAMQAFFASLTHELKTPLTSVRLQAESIADQLEAQSDAKPLIERLMADTHRLEAQVERTLELARVEGGGRLHTQTVRLKPWLDRFLRPWVEGSSETVCFDSQIEDVSIQADTSALQTILRNVIENAIRHSGQSPVGIVARTSRTEGKVVLTLENPGQKSRLDPSRLGVLFEKGSGSQGAGVGLYLIRALMHRMGGFAHFRSTGEGFIVELQFKIAEDGASDG